MWTCGFMTYPLYTSLAPKPWFKKRQEMTSPYLSIYITLAWWNGFTLIRRCYHKSGAPWGILKEGSPDLVKTSSSIKRRSSQAQMILNSSSLSSSHTSPSVIAHQLQERPLQSHPIHHPFDNSTSPSFAITNQQPPSFFAISCQRRACIVYVVT